MLKKVIIIDDNKNHLSILKSYFSDKYRKVYCAYNIEEGIKKIYSHPPDLIITDDEKLPKELFSILYPKLNYDLGVFCFYDYTRQDKVLYFDIKNFIFSPILKEFFISKLDCKKTFSNKKYIPNSKTIVSVDEFNSSLEFNFDYNKTPIAKAAFYSTNKNIWQNEKEIKTLKQVLNDFFTDRHISKNSKNQIEKNISNRYSKNKMDLNLKNNFNPAKTKTGMYARVINITNYTNIEQNSYAEDFDIFNTKISKKIINCLKEGEQIDKIEQDKYIVTVLAQDSIQAHKKFVTIYLGLDTIAINSKKLDARIGYSNCYINDNFNFQQAQKQALKALDLTTENNRTVIYAE